MYRNAKKSTFCVWDVANYLFFSGKFLNFGKSAGVKDLTNIMSVCLIDQPTRVTVQYWFAKYQYYRIQIRLWTKWQQHLMLYPVWHSWCLNVMCHVTSELMAFEDQIMAQIRGLVLPLLASTLTAVSIGHSGLRCFWFISALEEKLQIATNSLLVLAFCIPCEKK